MTRPPFRGQTPETLGSDPGLTPASPAPQWASGVCRGVHAVGIRDVVYVPDNPLSHVLRVFEREYPDVRLLLATREEEAFGIAAGLYFGGRRAAVMLQSSGLGNSLNALTSLVVPYQVPMLLVISMRGDDGEWNAAQVPMGRAVGSILEAIGIPHTIPVSPDAVDETIRVAGATAFGTRYARACLLPRRMTTTTADAITARAVPNESTKGDVRRAPLQRGRADGGTAKAVPYESAMPYEDANTDYEAPTPTSMTRLDATRVVVDLAGDAPIVASLGHPAYDLCAAGDRPQNLYTWGSMGLASSIGLGLAVARPDLRVFVLDGDGSLLMNLGSLATIGLLQPSNLTVIVMDNEEYATTGGQATPTAHGADLEAVARALRIAAATTVRNEADLRMALGSVPAAHMRSGHDQSLRAGPRVIIAKVAESAPTVKPPLDCVFIKQRFMTAIGNTEPAMMAW